MTVQITFDGDFVVNNKISMRTLAQSCMGMQKALERAYLDVERGGLSKGEKIRDEERKTVEFYLESYREGSFISIFKEITPKLKSAIDNLGSTMFNPYKRAIQGGDIEHQKIIEEAIERRLVLDSQPKIYEDALNDPIIYTPKQYAKKSMLNSVNDSLIPIKTNEGENSIKYTLTGDSSYEFYFDSLIATRFTKAFSGKEVGPEIIYESYVVKLDSKNRKGIIRHKVNNQEATILFINNSDYNKAVEYLKAEEDGKPVVAMKFSGYAIKEFDSLDLAAGDVVFKQLIEEKNG